SSLRKGCGVAEPCAPRIGKQRHEARAARNGGRPRRRYLDRRRRRRGRAAQAGLGGACEWRDRASPNPDGFGMELLTRVLPYELDAGTNVEFGPGGFRFTLAMPLAHEERASG